MVDKVAIVATVATQQHQQNQSERACSTREDGRRTGESDGHIKIDTCPSGCGVIVVLN